jgi:hypothetical protein
MGLRSSVNPHDAPDVPPEHEREMLGYLTGFPYFRRQASVDHYRLGGHGDSEEARVIRSERTGHSEVLVGERVAGEWRIVRTVGLARDEDELRGLA